MPKLSTTVVSAAEPLGGPLRLPVDVAHVRELARATVAALPEATVMVVDGDETVLIAEGRLLDRHGFDRPALSGRRLAEILPGAVSDGLRDHFRHALAGEPQQFEHLTSDGMAICWIELRPLFFGRIEPVAVLAVLQDQTERRALTSELVVERDRRLRAEELAGVGHWEFDPQSQAVTLSEGAARLLAVQHGPEHRLTELMERVDFADRERVAGTLRRAGDTGHAECECGIHGHDGVRRNLLVRATRAEGCTRLTGTVIDITELRAAEQARGESEALLQQGFDRSPVGMALTDAHRGRYLRVNEALCRLLGRSRQELLQLTYADVSHPDDAKIDEAGRHDMVAAACGSLEFEKRYLSPDGRPIFTHLNVVPVYGQDGEVRAFFSQIVDLTAVKEREAQLIREAADLERLAMIREALADDRLTLYAQPIVDVESGRVVQQELLVRLLAPDGGVMPPGEFLPVAERHGVIAEIDRWVCRRAMEVAATGQPVEVNISAASLGDARILSTIRESLARTGADPSLVVFEVTETALMEDIERGRLFAASIRDLGCQFALDDFGTGYGTFTYMKHIPIDYVKIDLEFVRDLSRSEEDEKLVRAMVEMARALGKRTIAEGVEDAETLRRLRDIGVDHAQGYHLGRPAPLDARALGR